MVYCQAHKALWGLFAVSTDLIKSLPVFKNLSDIESGAIARASSLENVSKHKKIYKIEDEIKYIYIVVKGSVKLGVKTSEEKQSALLTLGKLPVVHTKKLFEEQLDKMARRKLSPDVYIELSEAIDSSKDAYLISCYKTISAGLSADELTASYAGSLYGGNPEKGVQIFYGDGAAQCVRCD